MDSQDKKLSAEDDRLVRRILDLAHRIHTTTPYCVFFDYSGHVNWLSIRITESSNRYRHNLYDRTVYTSYRLFADVKEQSADTARVCSDLEAILAGRKVLRPPAPAPAAQPVQTSTRRTPRDIILKHYKEALKDGPASSGEIAARISKLAGQSVSHIDVNNNLVIAKTPRLPRQCVMRGKKKTYLLSLPT